MERDGGAGGVHGHCGCTRAIALHGHWCASLWPTEPRDRASWSCSLSLNFYFLLLSGTLHSMNLAFHGTPDTLTMKPSLGACKDPWLTLHGTHLSISMGPISHSPYQLQIFSYRSFLTDLFLHVSHRTAILPTNHLTHQILSTTCLTHNRTCHLTHHRLYQPAEVPS